MNMSDVNYYMITPNGRMKITQFMESDEEAIEYFKNHWTAKANWASGKYRKLIKETRETIYIEEITHGNEL